MRNLFDIRGKVAVVTGGSRGIGEMIASGYVENGATVYVSSRKKEVCDSIAAQLSAKGTCISLPHDLSTLDGIKALVQEVAVREKRLDILVNNAGAAWGAEIEDYPESGWDKVMDLNLKSVFFLTQQFLGLLRAGASVDNPARVINIASIDGLRPARLETYAYSASKAGCIMLTRQLAKRLARDNILVNAIAPGPFPSQMMAHTLATMGDEIRMTNPLRRIGTPEDIAGVAIFLASRASAYTTGATIPCDGGIAEVQS